MNARVAEFESRYTPVPECGCWLWTGGRYSNGYGSMPSGKKAGNEPAHRFAYRTFKGVIPAGLFVCHKCDTKSCVNPDHLFLGTHQQNMNDMVAKGRGAIGERHGFAKLSDEQVISIRADPRPLFAIAAEHGVSDATIHNVKRRKTWKHVGGKK